MLPDYKTYFDQMYIGLRALKQQENNGNCKKLIQYLEHHKSVVNNWLRNYDFSSEEEEIQFFKIYKPQLTSNIIYYKIRQDIYLNLPKSQKAIYKYYDRLLDKNNHVPAKLKPFYRYLGKESTHRDTEYFLRRNNISDINDQYHFIFSDERTCTKMDVSIAILIAREKIINHLETRLNEIEQQSKNSKWISNLKWTGTKIELIELIYSLQFVKVINAGNTDIKEIAAGMEHLFNIDLKPHLYGTYQDIKKRKTGQTKFLDKMSITLQTTISDEEI